MKTILLNLFILATIVLVSSALPTDRGEDRQSLLDSDTSLENGETPLQRRRPPIKVPGPKLRTPEEEETTPDDNLKMKRLSNEDKKKKDFRLTKDKKDDLASLDDDSKRGKKGKGKDKDLVRRDEDSTNEETQEESNTDIFGFSPQTEA